MTGWSVATDRLAQLVGEATPCGRYKLEAIDAGRTQPRLVFSRVASGKTITIARTLANRVWLQTADGGTLHRQQNAPKGGISYTAAISVCCAWALGLELNSENRWARSR